MWGLGTERQASAPEVLPLGQCARAASLVVCHLDQALATEVARRLDGKDEVNKVVLGIAYDAGFNFEATTAFKD